MRPTIPPTFDPNDDRYWDPEDLEHELERVFSVCHGCRMCVGYCPSFPSLFERVDAYVDTGRGEIEAFTDQDYAAVNDLCFQCKLCYFKCPYTPDDGHPFALDFPRLMLRFRAQRAKRNGIAFEDRVLGEPQLVGLLGSLGTPLSNWVSSQRLLRKVQEKATGISAHFPLPPFASRTLHKWARERQRAAGGDAASDLPGADAGRVVSSGSGATGSVVLFATCTVTYNLPAAGAAAVQVLEHNGYRVHLPCDATCCGMPNLDGGDVAAAQDKAARNVALLLPHVLAGRPVLVPGPTCSYVLKRDYPELLQTDDARLVAKHTFDLMEFLRDTLRAGQLRTDFKRALGRVGYHAPCHLRAQKVGFPAMQLLRKVPETTVEVIQECSGVDGTWGMKAAYYELGRHVAKKLVGQMKEGAFDVVASDCPLSGLRLQQELGAVPVHPIELLNDAYGLLAVRMTIAGAAERTGRRLSHPPPSAGSQAPERATP